MCKVCIELTFSSCSWGMWALGLESRASFSACLLQCWTTPCSLPHNLVKAPRYSVRTRASPSRHKSGSACNKGESTILGNGMLGDRAYTSRPNAAIRREEDEWYRSLRAKDWYGERDVSWILVEVLSLTPSKAAISFDGRRARHKRLTYQSKLWA